ncbi:MAG: hypothetical protein ABI838_03100, partial [Chloroflexota bacterium]
GYEVTTVVVITKRPRGYLATLLGAAGGAVVGALVGALPGAVVALRALPAGHPDQLTGPVLAGGMAIGAGLAAFGGAWVILRQRGYEGARDTALLLAGGYAVAGLVLGLALALVVKFARVDPGSAGVVLALLGLLVPPVLARALYLALAARRGAGHA